MNSKQKTTFLPALRARIIAILAVIILACPNVRAGWIIMSEGYYSKTGSFRACMDWVEAQPGYINFRGWVFDSDKTTQISVIASPYGLGPDKYDNLYDRPDVRDAFGLPSYLMTGFNVYAPCKSGTISGGVFWAFKGGIPYEIFKFSCTVDKPTATFDKQGGTGGDNSTLVDYSCDNPTITPPTRAGGYVFDGYYTGTNGTGTKYYNANGTSAAKWNECGGKTLYAKWLVAKNVDTGVGYISVQAAINAASNGQTIQMYANSTEDITIANGKTITLDLNGKVLKGTGTTCVVYVAQGGDLTVKDSGTTAEHKFTPNDKGLWVLDETNGTKTVKGGVITGGTGWYIGYRAGGGICNWWKLTLNGGNIVGNSTAGGGGIYNGQSDDGTIGSTFTMNGGCVYGNIGTYYGGGIGTNGKCVVKLLGGEVKYNVAPESGGVESGWSSDNPYTIGGDIVISDNTLSDLTTANNFYIYEGYTFSVGTGDEAPKTGMKVGVTTEKTPTTSTAVEFSEACAAGDTTYFFSDNNIYKVERNASNKLELCGYKLTYEPKVAGESSGFVRTIKGKTCPALPVLSQTGMYSPGWYTTDQTDESDPIPSSGKVVPGATVDFSEDRTVYAWWKKISYEEPDADGQTKETISKETVTNNDVLYTLNQAVKNDEVKNITVFDMTNSNEIENVEDVVNMVRNCPKSTPNTLIYVPENTEVPLDKSENVIVKDGESYTCVNFAVTDGKPVKVEYPFTADAATYNRSSSSRWGTICVPFQLKSNDRIQYYTSGTSYNGTLVLNKTATVEAGKPAIYCVSGIEGSNKGDINITYYDKNVLQAAGTSEESGSALKIGGTFTELKIDDEKAATEGFSGNDVYYYLDNTFYKRVSGQTVTIPALRAYILIPTANQ